MKIIFCFFILCIQSILFAKQDELFIQKALEKKLYKDEQWKRFYYTEGGDSLIQSKDFFASQGDSTNLQLEMEAFLREFLSPIHEKHVYCKFPARSKWLIKELNIPKDHYENFYCNHYETFKAMVLPQSVKIDFAAYYLNTPASAFGHTLLRLSKSDEGSDHLDYSINFGALPDTDNAVLYAIKGLIGSFNGNFMALPYHYKIQEYSGFESRDLWSYEIDLNPEQIEKLVDLIWELDGVMFPYYYLNKNCSFYLIKLLDAVDTKFHFAKELPRFYVIPIESVKVLFKAPGFVKSVSYRPSARKQFWDYYNRLTSHEKEIYSEYINIADKPLPQTNFGSNTQARLLDAALAQFDYQYPEQILNRKGPMYEKKYKFLVERSQIPVTSKPLDRDIPKGEEPHLGHSPQRLRYGTGVLTHEHRYDPYLQLGYRFSFHELEDPLEGHFFSKLNMMDLQGRWYRDKNRLRLHKASFVDAFNLNPMNRYEYHGSWQAELSLVDMVEPQCEHCYSMRSRVSYGPAFELWREKKTTLYSLGASRVDIFQKHSEGLQFGPAIGIQFGLWSHVFSQTDAFHLEYDTLYLPLAKSQGSDSYLRSTSLLYSLELEKNFRLHFGYERKNRIGSYEIRISQYF